jgi:anti-anti-sigma regulatory factor
LTVADAIALHQVLVRTLTKGLEVELELEAVAYMDATILQLIHAARKTALVNGARLTLQHVSTALKQGAIAVGMEAVLLADSGER